MPSTTRPGRRSAALRKEARTAWLMSSPALLLLALFLGIPILLTFVLSFTNTRLVSPNPPRFVGLNNFVRAFAHDPTFVRSLTNTAFFALIVVPCQSALALALAILVNAKVKGVTAFRTMIFMPVVTSMVVVSILWSFFYEENGLFNSMLNTLTGGGWTAGAWLNKPGTALPAGIRRRRIAWFARSRIAPRSREPCRRPPAYLASNLSRMTSWASFNRSIRRCRSSTWRSSARRADGHMAVESRAMHGVSRRTSLRRRPTANRAWIRRARPADPAA